MRGLEAASEDFDDENDDDDDDDDGEIDGGSWGDEIEDELETLRALFECLVLATSNGRLCLTIFADKV